MTCLLYPPPTPKTVKEGFVNVQAEREGVWSIIKEIQGKEIHILILRNSVFTPYTIPSSHLYTFTCSKTRAHTYGCEKIHPCSNAQVHVHRHVHTAHAHTHTYTHTFTHTHTHTQAYTCLFPRGKFWLYLKFKMILKLEGS